MTTRLHPNARTSPAVRAHIRESDRPAVDLASELGISVKTVRKWRDRGTTNDLPSTPLHPRTTLREGEEALVLVLRECVLLPLDDLLDLVRQVTTSTVSRSGLDRCLRRHGLGKLAKLRADVGSDSYPGSVHLHWIRLRTLPTGLLIGVDHATLWVGHAVLQTTRPRNVNNALSVLEQQAPFELRSWVIGAERFDAGRSWLAQPERYDLFRSTLRVSAKRIASRFAREEARAMLVRLLPSGMESRSETFAKYLDRYNAEFRPRVLKRMSPLEMIAVQKQRATETESLVAALPPRDSAGSRAVSLLSDLARPAGHVQRMVSRGNLPDIVGNLVRETQLAYFRDFEHEIGPLNLTPAAFTVLELLVSNPGMTQSVLAMALRTERSALVQLLDRLQALGLLTREASTRDRRRNHVLLTARGRALHAEATACLACHESRALRGFGDDEKAALKAMLVRIVDNLTPSDERGAEKVSKDTPSSDGR